MKKSIVIISAVTLGLATLSGGAVAQEPMAVKLGEIKPLAADNVLNKAGTATLLEIEVAANLAKEKSKVLTQERQHKLDMVYQQQLANNKVELENLASVLLDRVGKTRYVFSGSTPRGWDCSGLVVWAYNRLGIELEHSAIKQAKSGIEVDTPQVGDIIVYGNKSGWFHSTIYVGDGLLVHSGFKPGRYTEVIPMDHGSLAGLKLTIRRFLDTTE